MKRAWPQAAKKSSRIAAEGMAYATVENGVGVVVEVNAETDFASKTPLFVDFVKDIAKVVAADAPADIEALKNCKYPGSELTVGEMIPEKVMVIGENIRDPPLCPLPGELQRRLRPCGRQDRRPRQPRGLRRHRRDRDRQGYRHADRRSEPALLG